MTPEEWKQNRKDLGLTQVELAKELDSTQVYISYIETDTKTPSRILIRSFELLILSKKK